MELQQLLQLIAQGESSTVQFKEAINHIQQLAQELVAFANTEGGVLIIGVTDHGVVKGLDQQEIHKYNQWISNAALQNVKPPLSPVTEIITIGDKNILAVRVPSGYSKPYYTNEGIAYIKMGADKRIAPPEEILRLFQNAGKMYADESCVNGTTFKDIDESLLKKFLLQKFRARYKEGISELIEKTVDDIIASIDANITLQQLLQNMKLADGNSLTLAGILLLCNHPQRFKPLFSIRCISFAGNEITTNNFRDKEDLLEGSIFSMFSQSIHFLNRNLRKIQTETSFNSLGNLEIPYEVLEELVVNALVHRDYYINSAIQIFMFENRIEIISPGKLPNTLNETNIRFYTSIARNPILYTNAAFAGLPFTGIGSGIPRAVEKIPALQLVNDKDREQFKVTIPRPTVL